jgi:hypothetical protein
LLAANYLDIPKLKDYCSMTVADQIRGKKEMIGNNGDLEEISKNINF